MVENRKYIFTVKPTSLNQMTINQSEDHFYIRDELLKALACDLSNLEICASHYGHEFIDN